MRDQNDRNALLMQLIDNRHDLIATFRVQHRRRLVKNNAARFHRDHACDGDPLLLSARQKMRRLVLELPHIDRFQCLIHPLADFLRVHAQVFRSKSHIILDNCRNKLIVRILKYHARRLSDIPDMGVILRIIIGDQNIALRRQQKSVQILGEPEPFLPMMAVKLPGSISKETPSIAFTVSVPSSLVYAKVMFCTLIILSK